MKLRQVLFAVAVLSAVLADGVAIAKKAPPPPQFVVVRKLPPAALVSRMQAFCLQNGLSIVQATDSQVTCSKPMDGSLRSLFVRALATPSYSTNPVYFYRVSAVRVGDNTTVAGEEYVQYQNAYGQLTNIPLNSRKQLEGINAGLMNLKSSWEARLSAAGDDENAAWEASNAATAAAGGILSSSPQPAPQQQSATSPFPDASMHPSAPAAKQTLSQYQCSSGFRIVGESAGKTIFEAQCSAGRTQLVECRGMACKALQ